MPTVSEVTDVNLDGWVPGARMFRTEDDRYFIVDSDTAEHAVSQMVNYIRRATAVIFCNDEAVVDGTALDNATYEPGTTPEQAIELLGYQLTEGGS